MDPIPDMTSRPVIILPHEDRWASEYRTIATRLRDTVGATALRIDHIGSTSVPGLGAKDVIDVQVSVADLYDCNDLLTALRAIGHTRGDVLAFDSPSMPAADQSELAKRYMREPRGDRRTHIHIRQSGAVNQRYALLFRDYLRATPSVRASYETVKRRAAQLFPTNIDGYIWLKDAPIQIIHEAAVLWAVATHWEPSREYE